MMNLPYSNTFTAWNRYSTSLPSVPPQATLPPAPPTAESWESGDTVSLGGAGTHDLLLMPSPWKLKEAIASKELPFDISASRPAFTPGPAPAVWLRPALGLERYWLSLESASARRSGLLGAVSRG